MQIREQLAKVVQSAGFRQCTRIKRFLIFIVEETLAQRGRQLCEYTIGVCVFDRNESFEPGLDPIVRNDARRLRHKLLEYYQQHSDARPDLVVITVPKGGYVPVFSRATGSAGKGLPAAYRLNVSLTRMADGAELISKTYDLESKSCSLQFELTGVDSDLQGDGHQ